MAAAFLFSNHYRSTFEPSSSLCSRKTMYLLKPLSISSLSSPVFPLVERSKFVTNSMIANISFLRKNEQQEVGAGIKTAQVKRLDTDRSVSYSFSDFLLQIFATSSSFSSLRIFIRLSTREERSDFCRIHKRQGEYLFPSFHPIIIRYSLLTAC